MVVGEGRRLDGINVQDKLQLKLVESRILNQAVALPYLKQ
jgi:hypothetical protein